MKMRCAVLDDYQNAALRFADWSPTQVELKIYNEHFESAVALRQAILDFEIVVAMRERTPFDRALLETLPNLRLLQTTARRNPAIDLHAAEELGILCCGTDALPYPTAELTWGLILGLTRDIAHEQANFRAAGHWQTRVGRDLNGRTLGVLGLGTLGAQVARIGQAFGMKVIAWSHHLQSEQCLALGVEHVSKSELVRRSDVLTIHTQLSRRTEHLIDWEDFAAMKPSALLINTSRGPIVREAALVHALSNGLIAGAGLDTFDIEPLPKDHPLRSLPNVVATPHMGYVSEDNYRLWFGQIVENICAWREGRVLRRMDPARNVNRAL
jgi:D-3-phosphoglycerate dehydrogenase